jgi:elongation factor 2
MMEKLWGDNFFDPATKKWTKKDTGAASCKRGFVQFVYDPIKTIIEACMNDNKVKLFAMTDKLGITGKLKKEDKDLMGKPLMKKIMQSWLPAHEVSISCPRKIGGTPCCEHPASYVFVCVLKGGDQMQG